MEGTRQLKGEYMVMVKWKDGPRFNGLIARVLINFVSSATITISCENVYRTSRDL